MEQLPRQMFLNEAVCFRCDLHGFSESIPRKTPIGRVSSAGFSGTQSESVPRTRGTGALRLKMSCPSYVVRRSNTADSMDLDRLVRVTEMSCVILGSTHIVKPRISGFPGDRT